MSKKNLWGMKYFLAFSTILVAIYIYSMATGWRFLSYDESNKINKGGTHSRGHYSGNRYYHK